MSLTLLPLEVLREIIRELIPESFEELALTCKYTFSACLVFIPKHNQYRKKYRYYPDREKFIAISNANFFHLNKLFPFRSPARYESPPDEQNLLRDSNQYELLHSYHLSESPEQYCSAKKYFSSVQEPLNLMQDIAQDPIIARYVSFVDLGFIYRLHYFRSLQNSGANFGDNSRSKFQVREDHPVKRLAQSMTLSKCWDGHEVSWNQLLEDICQGVDPGPISIFLLALLPNIKEIISVPPLIFDYTEMFSSDMQRLLERIWDWALTGSDGPAPLSKLNKLHFIDASWNLLQSGRTLISIFFLSKLKHLRIANINAGQYLATRLPEWVSQSEGQLLSNLEILELYESCRRTLHFALDFYKMKRLRCVKLYYGRGIEVFVRRMMEARSDSIEHLSVIQYKDSRLLDYVSRNSSTRKEPVLGIADLSGFKCLRNLELDTQLLLGTPVTSGSQISESDPEISQKLIPHKDSDILFNVYRDTILPLVDILPSSVETLTLADGAVAGTALFKRLFTGFSERKAEALPHLTRVTVYIGGSGLESVPGAPLPEELRKAKEVVNLVLRRECLHSKIKWCN